MTRFLLLFMFAAFGTSARADVPLVATDIRPVHSLVARVMAGLGAPDLIIRAGGSPHSYALKPSQALALERADLVIWIGPGLTPWMEKPLQVLAGDARTVALMELGATIKLPVRERAIFDDPAQDQDHGATDPHGWLDPMNGRAWLMVIARELAALDPENAEIYLANAAAGQSEIDAAMIDAADLLAPMKDLPIAEFHDAFQYFEARFALSPKAAIFASDARTPGPARIAALQQLMQAEKIACLIAEPLFDQGFAELVLDGSEANMVVLDPLGAELEAGSGLYVAVIGAMAAALAGCG